MEKITQWFKSLLGRSKPPVKSEPQVTPPSPALTGASLEKSGGSPVDGLPRSLAVPKSQPVKSSPKLNKKLVIVIIVIIFFFGILLLIGIGLSGSKDKKEVEKQTSEPSPTPVSYQSYKPSVYADDPAILRLEEDLSILEREIQGTNLKQGFLSPPTLDFNIKF